jgi:hypothetical protein
MVIADQGLNAFHVFLLGNMTVSILLSRGDGIFPAAPDFGVGLLPELITMGDFDSDGRPDLATTNGLGADTLSIFFNNTTGGVMNDLAAFDSIQSSFTLKSVPWCASDTSPGSGIWPPPSKPASESVCWGAGQGCLVMRAVWAPVCPATQGMRVVSSTSARLIAGRMVVSRRASIDLPAPGVGYYGQNACITFSFTEASRGADTHSRLLRLKRQKSQTAC